MKTIFGLWFALCLSAGAALPGPAWLSSTAASAAAGEWTGYHAVQYDGSVPNRLDRTSGWTGAADGTTGMCSFWVKFTDDDTVSEVLYNAGGDFTFGRNRDGATGNHIIIFMWSHMIMTNSTTLLTAASGWHHILAAWDTASAANCKLYVDGVDETMIVTRTGTIDYTLSSWYVGVDATSKFRLSEMWFAPNQWLDLSNAGNRAKFRSPGGKPVDLGTDGATPTGTQPILYLRSGYATCNVNAGTGGDMTIIGAPADSDADKP